VSVSGLSRHRRRRAWSAAALLAATALAWQISAAVQSVPAGAVDTSSTMTPPTGTSSDGSFVASETAVDARMVDIGIHSVAMGRTIMVRLMLPRDWNSDPAATWPSLWMLEGSGDPADYKGWTTHTDLEQFMSDKNVLVVMPSDGSAGLYTDWVGPSATGLPQNWETFHTAELAQLLTLDFRANGVNAAAGDSTGGLGALAYAARHPGLFRAAASFSGLIDTADPGARTGIAVMELRDTDNPFGPFGSPWSDSATWAAHDPTALVDQLKGVDLFVSSGNGLPGPLGWSSGGAVLETSVYWQTTAFVHAAQAAGVPVTTDFYGGGVHDWPYWNRELPVAWPTLARGLGIAAS
jgi:S-formylglutathione hydrolase FrmB